MTCIRIFCSEITPRLHYVLNFVAIHYEDLSFELLEISTAAGDIDGPVVEYSEQKSIGSALWIKDQAILMKLPSVGLPARKSVRNNPVVFADEMEGSFGYDFCIGILDAYGLRSPSKSSTRSSWAISGFSFHLVCFPGL